MKKVFLLVLMVLSVVGGPSWATQGPKKLPQPKSTNPPMHFQIMRASNASCEPSCPEWIYAEGEIVPGTAARFNQVLRDAGKATLPMVIESGGGDVRAAMAMGRAIRAHKMTVAVGHSYYSTCVSDCGKDPKPKTVAAGWITSSRSYCASACTLVLAAGVQRMAADGSMVGTHQILNKPMFERIYYREKYLIIHGRKKVISRTITKRVVTQGKSTTKLPAGFEAELQRYFNSMGLDKHFLDFYAKAPPSSIYNMSKDERLASLIVTSPSGPEGLANPALCAGTAPAAHCVLIKK